MKNSQVYSNPLLVRSLTRRIGDISTKPLKIMEFCGTHSHAIYRYGIRQSLTGDYPDVFGARLPRLRHRPR